MTTMTTYKSPLADIEIPAVTVPDLIEAVIAEQPDSVALLDPASGRTLTYGELGSAADRVAGAFVARGLRPGQTVGIVAPNSPDWPIAALGIMRAGGVLMGANPAYLADELAHQFQDAGARIVIAAPALLETVAAAANSAGGIDELIILGDNAPEAEGIPVTAFSALLGSEAPRRPIEASLDDVCALPYSSGTTGRTKGVRLTHRTLVANVCQIGALAPIQAGDRVMSLLPMFHIFGFAIVTLGGLAKGATLVTLPGFEPRSFLRAIQDERIKTVFVVPPIANFLATHPIVDEFDLSSLRTIGCGAAPLGEGTEKALAARLGCQVGQGYGMTESNGCISYPNFAAGTRPGSSGVLLPNSEAKIIDPETGASQPPGATGELWFRGPHVFAGYLNNPEATAETIDADGWTRTGDLGQFDDEGHLFITDRLKELIKVKGFQVAPAELEALLLTHPDIADAAVIGRLDQRAGERPVAYVVPRAEVDPEAVAAWLAERVSEYKELADVVLIDAIPKNPSGKILRRVLRETDAARG